MASDTRKLKIVVTGDSSDGVKALNAVEQKGEKTRGMFGRLSGSVGAFGSTLRLLGTAAAGGAVVGFLGSSVSKASDLNETMNKATVIFGKNAGTVVDWSKQSAKSFGLSQESSLAAAAQFGNMFQQLGFGGQEATKMSTGVVKLAADLGSFNNLGTEEVLDMISAGLRGEYDSLQRIIPTINAATVEKQAMADTGKESAKALTQQEKAAATMTLIMKGASAAENDFAETSGGLANKKKILAATISDLQVKLGQKLLPVIQTVVTWFADKALPAIEGFTAGLFKGGQDLTGTAGQFASFGNTARQVFDNLVNVVTTYLVPAIREIITVVADVMGWFQKHEGVVKALGVAIGAMTLLVWAHTAAMKASAAAQAVQAAGGFLGWINKIMSATKIWTAIQWALNAAFWSNPITLVVLAIAALIAAVVLAYQKHEGFRNLVNAVWKSIQAAAAAVVNWFRTSVVPILSTVFTAIGNALRWLYNNVFKPNFELMRIVASNVFNWIRNTGWPILRGAFDAIITTVRFLWNNVFRPTFDLILAIVSKVFGWIRNTGWPILRAAFDQMIANVRFLWNNVWSPVFTFISNKTQDVINFISRVLWPILKNAFALVVQWVSEAWDTFRDRFDNIRSKVQSVINFFTQVIVPAVRTGFEDIKTFVTTLWNTWRERFDALQKKITEFKDAALDIFRKARDGIGLAWDGIKAKLRDPLNAVIRTVYTNGIRKMWNWVAEKVNIGQMPEVKEVQFARGGPVHNFAGRPNRDSVKALMKPGEHVWTPEEVKGAGGHAAMFRLRAMARAGAIQKFDEGGIVGAISGTFNRLKGKAEEFVLGNLLNLADPLIKSIRAGIGALPEEPGGLPRALPTKILDAAIEFIKSKDIAPSFGGDLGTGGDGITRILDLAKKSGIPYRVTSTFRPGDPLYHGSRRAVDFGGYNQDRFAQYWEGMASSLLELIHRTNSRDYGWSHGRRYAKGSNNQLLNEHRNHIHVAMNGNATVGGTITGIGNTSTVGMAPGAIRDANKLPQSARGWLADAARRTGVSTWQMPLQSLAWRESGGNPNARSFSSNGPLGYAIGLLQLLSTTFAAYRDRSLPNDRTHPVANSVAGINWIKARYGSIYKLAHAVGEHPAPGGYDNGGWLRPGWNWNGTGGPEMALNTEQGLALKKGIDRAVGNNGGIHIDNLNVTVTGTSSKSDATRIAKEIRDELKRLERRTPSLSSR